MSVLTEDDVRKLVADGKIKEKGEFYLPPKQVITPSARAYLTEKNVTIKTGDKQSVSNNVDENKPPVVFDTLFGAKLTEKPEHMTHLRGNMLVFKDHPRIALRGGIDSLESNIILVQILAQRQNLIKLVDDLEEIISFIRKLLRCEVAEQPVGDFFLQGLTAVDLREQSHHPSKYFGISHFLPSYKQGEIVANLNMLRTKTREVELVAYRAFSDDYGIVSREDIIKAFNRLSSLFWIMTFKYMSGKYE